MNPAVNFVPCRIGTKRMYEMLEKITKGEGTLEDLDKLEELCYYIKDNALCGLGQTAPNPVLSTLSYFRDEYIAHIVDKNVLPEYVRISCHIRSIRINVKGCTLCARNLSGMMRFQVNKKRTACDQSVKNVSSAELVWKNAASEQFYKRIRRSRKMENIEFKDQWFECDSAPAGSTILEAAQAAGIKIPTLVLFKRDQ